MQPRPKVLGNLSIKIFLLRPFLFKTTHSKTKRRKAGMPCAVISAQERDTKLESCTTRDSIGSRVSSGWHAAQMQVNTSRDSGTAVPPLKCVFISPDAKSARLRCITFTPHWNPSSGQSFHKGILISSP